MGCKLVANLAEILTPCDQITFLMVSLSNHAQH